MVMQKHKRPTKLEEGNWRLHLDIDGNNKEVLDHAMKQVRHLVELITGQEDIGQHDVSLVVSVVINERDTSKGKIREAVERTEGRDVGMGQRV